MSEDKKMLLSAAALVTLGAVGIALLASCNADRDARAAKAERAPAAVTTQSDVLPASIPPRDLGSSSTVTIAADVAAPAVEETAPAFEIEPGADLVARGLETYRAREFDRSAIYFRAEAEARPGRAWTHYMLGLAQWKSGELDEASASMKLATELDPGWIKSFVNLSRIENDRGRFDEALEAARAAVTIDPRDAEALFLEGRSLRNAGRFDEAMEALAASIEIDPDNGYVHNLYGLTLLEQDRADEAVDVLARAAELAPEVAFVHNNLGMALERTGRLAEAVVAYRAAVEVDASHARATANLARLDGVTPQDAGAPESTTVAASAVADPEKTEVQLP